MTYLKFADVHDFMFKCNIKHILKLVIFENQIIFLSKGINSSIDADYLHADILYATSFKSLI